MKGIFGGVLMAIGILIAGASGLCSVAVLFSSGGMALQDASMLPAVLLMGGIPLAFGVTLAYIGRMLVREAKRERDAGGS
jgi:hypothetical protein